MDGSLIDTITPSQSEPESNGNEMFPLPHSSRTEASPSNGLVSYPGYSLRVLHLGRDVVGVFDWPS